MLVVPLHENNIDDTINLVPKCLHGELSSIMELNSLYPLLAINCGVMIILNGISYIRRPLTPQYLDILGVNTVGLISLDVLASAYDKDIKSFIEVIKENARLLPTLIPPVVETGIENAKIPFTDFIVTRYDNLETYLDSFNKKKRYKLKQIISRYADDVDLREISLSDWCDKYESIARSMICSRFDDMEHTDFSNVHDKAQPFAVFQCINTKNIPNVKILGAFIKDDTLIGVTAYSYNKGFYYFYLNANTSSYSGIVQYMNLMFSQTIMHVNDTLLIGANDFTTDGPEDRTYDYKKVVTTQTISVAAYDFTGEQNE